MVMDVCTPQSKIMLGQLFLKRKKSFTVRKIACLVMLKNVFFLLRRYGIQYETWIITFFGWEFILFSNKENKFVEKFCD